MNIGTVKSFHEQRGFGFIRMEDGREVFAHFSQIQSEGFKKLTAGQAVRFELYETLKGYEAKNIVID
jgi:CspA family cold shock protein